MEPSEIFELLVTAAEKLKYATPAMEDARRGQARQLLERARAEARATGTDALVARAEQRLADLVHPPIAGAAERRPTPLDPYPAPRDEEGEGDEKADRPEPGTGRVAVPGG